MTQVASRGAARQKRHDRIRLHLEGTVSRGRVSPSSAATSTSTRRSSTTPPGGRWPPPRPLEKELRGSKATKTEEAAVVGRLVAERAKAAGVERVVFDRAGFRYHGRIKSLADAAREAGLEF